MKDKIGFVILLFFAIITVILSVNNYILQSRVNNIEIQVTETKKELTTLQELGTDEKLNDTLMKLSSFANDLDEDFRETDEQVQLLAEAIIKLSERIEYVVSVYDDNVVLYNKKFREIYNYLIY